MKRKSLLLCLSTVSIFLSSVMTMSAHDFQFKLHDGNVIFLNITDSLKRTVEVTYEGEVSSDHRHLPKGSLELPAMLKYDGKFYSVVSIGPKAFSGAKNLVSVSLPSFVTSVGAFAFENCTALKEVSVSAKECDLTEGAFFNCISIEDVVFSGKCTSMDLSEFKWSDSLKAISVPASVKQIKNLKELKNLETVEVDENNQYFSSKDGLLYSKDALTLYACPRGRSGKVEVGSGTTAVLDGAFRDCLAVTDVVLPSDLKSISYFEFSRSKSIRSITFSGEPVFTATLDGKEVFALAVANPEVKIIVPKKSFKKFVKAVSTSAGQYADLNGKNKNKISAENLVSKKNILKNK